MTYTRAYGIGLLLAAAIGLMVGRMIWTRDQPSARAPVRPVPQPELDTRVPETATPEFDPPLPPPLPGESLPRAGDEEHPLADTRLGRIEIDMSATRLSHVTVIGWGLAGWESTEVARNASGVSSVDVVPGQYTVTWDRDDGTSERESASIHVDAGAVTRVATSAYRGAAEPPSDLATVAVLVTGTDGIPLDGVRVTLAGPGMRGQPTLAPDRTDEAGECTFRVRPGKYIVSAGASRRVVVVTADRAAAVTMSSEREGTLRIRGAPFGAVVRPAGEREWLSVDDYRRESAEDCDCVEYVYLVPGSYEVGYADGCRLAGTVAVQAQHTSTFVVVPPQGSVQLRLSQPVPIATRMLAHVDVAGPTRGTYAVGSGALWLNPDTFQQVDDSLWIPYLRPGAHDVTLTLGGFATWAGSVTVATTRAELWVELKPTDK